MEQIIETLSNLSMADFVAIKQLIAQEEKTRYNEMWWTHDAIDSYIYKVHLANGDYRLFCKGKQAYDFYEKDIEAVWIERYTKDLFPTYEFLERKAQA